MHKKVLLAAVIALISLVIPVRVFAENSRQISRLPADETYEGDYYATGEIVEITGTVEGDVYVAGGQVFINGVITGDLIAVGGQILFAGSVGQDARLAGGTVTILGEVEETLTAVGGSIDVTGAARLNGNVQIVGGNASVQANLPGDLKAGVGNLILSGSVAGNVETAVGEMLVGPSADIGGNLTYFSEETATIDSNASISGQVTKRDLPFDMKHKSPTQADVDSFFDGLNLAGKVISIVTTLVLGFVLIKFLPRYTQKASSLITDSFVKSFAIGFVAIIVVPIMLLFMFVTIISIPLAIFLTAGFIIYLFLARVYVMVALGDKLSKMTGVKLKQGSGWDFILGLVVYYLLTFIPIVGGLIKFVVLVAGFGAALRNERLIFKAGRKAKIL